jgi:hypothetical protein
MVELRLYVEIMCEDRGCARGSAVLNHPQKYGMAAVGVCICSLLRI